MNILRSQIIGLPVGAVEQRAKIGAVKDVIINPDDGATLGLMVGTGLLSLNKRVITWQDVRSLARDGVVVTSANSAVKIDEVIRIKKLLDDNFNLIGLAIVTSADDKLGHVQDYAIDTVLGQLKSISCRNHIINKSKIIRIEKDKVVVSSGAQKADAARQICVEPSMIQ